MIVSNLVSVALLPASFGHHTGILANLGTPMMLSGCYNLLLGNIVIGLLEGILIAWLFRVPRKRTIYLMIAGNYASMIVGIFLIRSMGGYSALGWDSDVHTLKRQLVLGAAASFAATLLIEWPFCLVALKSCSRRLGKSILANGLAQAASYAVLIPAALAIGQFSVLTDVRIDPNLVSETADDASIYYQVANDNAVHRIRLNGTKQEKIASLDRSRGLWDFCLMQDAETGVWDLRVQDDRDADILLDDVRLPMIPKEAEEVNQPFGLKISPNPRSGRPIDYRPENQRDWTVEIRWLELTARNTKTKQVIRVGLDTQFATWLLYYPTLLPGNRLVFVANRQILLLDLNTRRLGAITKGWMPIVVPDCPSDPRPTTAPTTTQTGLAGNLGSDARARAAKKAAETSGYTLRDYCLVSRSDNADGSFFRFERRQKRLIRGGDNHFGVLVRNDGTTHVQSGR